LDIVEKHKKNTQTWTKEEVIEHQEICEFCRHDDQIAYQAGSIFIPISFAILPIAMANPLLKIPLVIFSVSIFLYWILISDRMAFFSRVRRNRAMVLEKKAGIQLLTQNSNPPKDMKKQKGYRISIVKARSYLFASLIIGWILIFWLG